MPNMIKILIALFFCAGCQSQPDSFTLSGATMGTTYNITVVSQDGGADQAALQAVIDAALIDVNAKYSNWDEASVVSQFNAQRTTDPVSASADFLNFMAQADQVHAQSGGYLDLTVAPLVALWGFFEPGLETDLPSEADIADALIHVGQAELIEADTDAGTLRKLDPDVMINLAAIAKGYSIDRLASEVRASGYQNFLVEIGGDFFAAGRNARGEDWSLGIERPDMGRGLVQQIVKISDQGMATSGDYRNYFQQDGVRYSHIIDPLSGRPVSHRTASVTVFAQNAALADGWATALLAAGTERGSAFADNHNIQAIFIQRTEDGAQRDFEVTSSRAYREAQPTSATP